VQLYGAPHFPDDELENIPHLMFGYRQ